MLESLKVAAIKSFVKRKLGRSIRPVETMSANPTVLIGYARYSQTLMSLKRVDEKLKALARVRAAKMVECPF
jgi:hypothetical protein